MGEQVPAGDFVHLCLDLDASGIFHRLRCIVAEMGDFPQRAAGRQGTQHVSSNIIDVQRGAAEASSQVLSAAQSLSRDSNRLKLEVGKFLNTVRAP
jgi:hypothetical protein